MKQGNTIQQKSISFAMHMVDLYLHLTKKKKEFVLSKQILRSGTSIGANVEEALQGQSRADFISKLSIALKEASETCYWIKLLRHGAFITPLQAESLLQDVYELIRLLTAIIKSTKRRP